jgi:hypothetical protein
MPAPKLFDPDEWWPLICEMIADGMSLSAICRTPGFPRRTLVKKWKRESIEKRREYAEAIDDRGEILAEGLEEIASEEPPAGMDGPATAAWIARQRLRVDVAKWSASKLSPGRFGEKLEIENRHIVTFDIRAKLAKREACLREAIEGEIVAQPTIECAQVRARDTELLPDFLTLKEQQL